MDKAEERRSWNVPEKPRYRLPPLTAQSLPVPTHLTESGLASLGLLPFRPAPPPYDNAVLAGLRTSIRRKIDRARKSVADAEGATSGGTIRKDALRRDYNW